MNREIDLEEYKKILIDVLKEIHCFCETKGIAYYLIGGTLLGAIRHKGFIPWDDDIDIAMLRSDYEIFIRSFNSSSERYRLLSLETDSKYNYPFAKVVDTRVALIENVSKAVEISAYVDVFPLDNCPGLTRKKAHRSLKKMSFFKWLRNFKTIRIEKRRSFWKNVVLALGKFLTCCFSARFLSEIISMKSKKNKEIGPFVADYVNTTYGDGEILLRDYFSKTIDVEFEGYLFKAPIGYDKILTAFYGNYMELPPVEKRITHHDFNCWYRKTH